MRATHPRDGDGDDVETSGLRETSGTSPLAHTKAVAMIPDDSMVFHTKHQMPSILLM